jgi:hypothetical protein
MNALVPWSPPVNIMPEAAMEFGGKLYIYRGRARDSQHRHVFVADDGLSRDFADTEIVRLLEKPAAGSKPPMRWVTAAEMANIKAGKASNWSSLYAEAGPLEKLRVDTLLVYIRAWEHAGGPSRTEEALSRLIAHTAEVRGVARISASSLQRALRRYDGDIDSLVNRDDLKGNSNPKVDQKVREMHQGFVCDAYFVPQRPSAAAVHLVVLQKFRDWNAALPANACPLVPLSLSTTRTMIEEEGRFIHDYTRMGRRQAKARHRAVTKAPEASSANEVWEVDASLLPVIALDDETLLPIGRPTATFLLDRQSRAVPGFDFAWRSESFHSVAEAVRMGVSTKDALMAASGISGVYPMCGLPGMLVADQAQHTRATGGAAFKLMCGRIGCEPSNTPVLKPWFKGKIERLLRTYFFKMCHVVPGTTYSDIFARSKETPPEKVAICTFSELKAHVLRFIVEIYHPKYHRGIENSPLAAYKASASMFGITPPPDHARLTAILSVPYSRTVQASGLEINGLHYNSAALMEYRQVTGRADKVGATVDRQDIAQAWWIDPRDGQELRIYLPEVDRNRYRGVSIEKYERVRALQRNNPEMLAGNAGAERAYALYLNQILELGGSKGLTNRRRAMRAWERLRNDAHAKFNDDVEEIPVTEGGLLDEVLGAAGPSRPGMESASLPQPVSQGDPPPVKKTPGKARAAKASKHAPAPDDASTVAAKAAAAVSGSVQPLPPENPDPQDDEDDLADIRAQAAQLLEGSRQGRREDNE